MKKVLAFVKKYPKSTMFLAVLLFTGITGALGQQFADNAKTQGGFVTWCVLQGLSVLAFFGTIIYLGKHGAGDQ